MRKFRIRYLGVFALYFSFMQVLLAQPIDNTPLSPPELITALQSGGHIIYMRHSQTDHKQKDQGATSLEHCDKQRNLSVAGRELAQGIGDTIKRLNIPIANVLSSPYCRCKDTAKLAFGDFRIEPNLQFSFSKNDSESKELGS
ncbi:MAG: histidine phosphatase family protein [Pseudomonadales bacterium]|nr:histidine phosphatase family protein [Pseudomonadales bacterium]